MFGKVDTTETYQWLLKNCRDLHQDSVMPGLLSRQNAPQVMLEGGSRVRQAERHANVAMRQTLTASHARRPEALLRCGSVEPCDVDADAQPTILTWMGSHARRAAVAAHGSFFFKLASSLGDELLNVGLSSPCAFLRKTCREARLQVVPERLPHDVGEV